MSKKQKIQIPLPVKEIASELGFEDEKYFNRLFSKIIGVLPEAFRKADEIPAYL